METTYGTPATLGVNDGFLVSNPQFHIKPNVLERNFVRNDLSPMPFIIGRKIASVDFETELRGNGMQQSGVITDAPLIARLFRACGYALSAAATSSIIGPYPVGQPSNPGVALTTSAASATNTDMIYYDLVVTTGGLSGAAHITVSSDTAGENTASTVVTSGTPFTLGTKGATVTLTWTGSLALGDRYVLWLAPAGQTLKPRSDNFESVTIGLHKDGVLHTMPGSFGTFQLTAQAGNFATIKWTFTGTFVEPVDSSNPSPVFELTLPSQVELARLEINDFHAVVEKFTFNQQNDIQIRPDVSSSDGYIGIRIVNRKPEGGIDPEADTVASNDFWGQFAAAQRMPLQMRVGTKTGNTVWFIAPNVQYSGMTYADRQGILVYDAGLRFARSNGDDECFFVLI
jgi:hypothetical protein